MDDQQHPVAKALTAWLLVGVSHMSPLEGVQFVAAILAILYTLLLIWQWFARKSWRPQQDNDDRTRHDL